MDLRGLSQRLPPASRSAVPAEGAEPTGAPVEETALGRLISNTLNNVLLPLEVGALTSLERGLEKLTGHVVFEALAPAPPPVPLKRPLLMIPGLFMQPQSFDTVANHFASAPGARKAVAIYDTEHDQLHLKSTKAPPITKDAELRSVKPIKLDFSNPMAPADEKAAQIDRALDTIAKRYGQTIHVAAHSQGNEAFLLALLDRAKAGKPAVVESFTNLGGVEKGTLMGNIGAVAGGLAGVKESGAEVAFGGEVVKLIEENWDLIRSQIKGGIHNVAFAGGPTMGADGQLAIGDGFTTVRDQGVPDGTKEVLRIPDVLPTAHLVEIALPGSAAAIQSTIVKDELRIAKGG